MNSDQLREAARVMMAAADGLQIQFRQKGASESWRDASSPTNLDFNFLQFEYRIKSEPREFWIDMDVMCVCCAGKGCRMHAAIEHAPNDPGNWWVRVREVLDDEKA